MATLTVKSKDEQRVKGMGFLSNKGTDNFNARVITVNGKITAEQIIGLGEAAKKYGSGDVEFTSRLNVEVPGIPYDKIEEFQQYISQYGLVTGGTGAKVRPIVSCKGTTCRFGLIDTFALSEEIHDRFFVGYNQVKLPHKFKIAVGGCPNNCVKPTINDLGVMGQRKPVLNETACKNCKKCAAENECPTGAGKKIDGKYVINRRLCNNCGRCMTKCNFQAIDPEFVGYKIFIGGMWGKKHNIGSPLPKIFTDKEEVLDTIEKAILLFRKQGNPGERFAQIIKRIGLREVKKQLLSDDLLNRKEEILKD